MPFIQNNPSTPLERAVKNTGYRWFQTNGLRPYESDLDSPAVPFLPDRLDHHVHHSTNTHLIVCGRLTVDAGPIEGQYRGLDHVLDAEDANAYKELRVSANQSYKGKAGSEGAVFVEAHAILSPTTAERFFERGTIYWQDDGSGRCFQHQAWAWFEEERIQNASHQVRDVQVPAAGRNRYK